MGRGREDGSGALVCEVLGAGRPPGRWLSAGLEVPFATEAWFRTATGGRRATPFPPAGPWDGIVLRWPGSREAGRMTVAVCAGRLAPDGILAVAAPNDEGGRSLSTRLEPMFEALTEHYGHHARAVVARRPRPTLATDPDAWVTEVSALDRTFTSWPGLFAHGRLDPGTALLLGNLPALAGKRVLDFGCGIGVVGAAALAAGASRVELVDVDALAVHAARRNLPGCTVHLRDGVPDGGPWDVVLSNPPLHTGAEVDPQLLRAFAERVLITPGGNVTLVTLHTVPVQRLFPKLSAARVAEAKPYVVWRLTR